MLCLCGGEEGRGCDGLDLAGCLRNWAERKDKGEEGMGGGMGREGGGKDREEGSGALPTELRTS